MQIVLCTAVYDENSKLQMAAGSFSFSTQQSMTFIYPGNANTWPFLIMTWLGGFFHMETIQGKYEREGKEGKRKSAVGILTLQ